MARAAVLSLSMEEQEMLREVAGCFNDCQRANAAHNRCVQSLRKLYLQKPDCVADLIARMLAKVLRVPKKEANVERVIKFVGKLVKDISLAEDRLFKKKGKRISLDSQFSHSGERSSQSSLPETQEEHQVEQSFRYTTIRFLMRFTEAEDKAARWRSCQLIGAICSAMAEARMIGPQLKEDLVEIMLQRTHDRIPPIRCSAIRTLFYLLDPDLESDKPIIKEFKRLMEKDSHQEVRKAAVQCFPVSGESLSKMLKRTRDVNPDVRKTAFRSLALSTPIIFNEAQLAEVLEGGLRDRDTKVQKACLAMVQRWIAEVPLLNVLELLNVVDNESTAEVTLRQLFSAGEDMETLKVSPPSDEAFATFSAEEAILWRVSIEPHQGEAEEPSVSLEELNRFVQQAARGDGFVLKQLISASLTLIPLANEHFRREYSRALRNLLLNETSVPVVSQQLCMDALAKIHSNQSEFLQIMLETLADIVEPLDDEEEDSDGDDEEAEDEIMASQERSVATRSSEVHVRALVLVEKILGNTTLTAEHPGIAGLLQAIIIPAVQHRHVDVRSKGLKCFGLYCLLDMDMAASNLLLFVQAASRDSLPVKLVAAQTLFDFLSRYDPMSLLQQEEEWPREFKMDVLSQADQVSEANDEQRTADRRSFTMLTLVKFLRHNDTDIRTVAVEGFAKLLLNNFITDPQILSTLVTLYFHPATDSSSALVQCLGAFFPAYSIGGAEHQHCLEECFMPTIRRILTSSRYSPLRKVPVDKVAMFVLQHLSTSLGSTKSVHHDRLAVELAEEIYAMGAYVSDQGKLLCKVVCKQGICGDDKQLVHRLTATTLQLARKTTDKNLQRSLQSLFKKLSEMCPSGAGSKRLFPVDEAVKKKKRRTGDKQNQVVSVLQRIDEELSEDSNIPSEDQPELGKRKAAPAGRKTKKSRKAGKTAPLMIREEKALEFTQLSQAPAGKDQSIVLAFTGFSEQDPAYNFVNLKKLVGEAKSLGARVLLGNVIDPCITHMVSPPKRRTMKTLIASLANKWVIDPQWITKSMSAGEFLPEEGFGKRTRERPFRRKLVHISTQFMEENPNRQFTLAIFKTLIADLGGGQIVRAPKGADMVLCGQAMKARHRSDSRYMDWKDWFGLIQPDQ